MYLYVYMLKKAAFFDRDGVLNIDKGYLYKIEDFAWMPHAREAVKYLHDKGYLVVVVTNQSGVARGYYTEAEVQNLHEYMQQELAELGTAIDAFYHCPHLPDATVPEYAQACTCRKPMPGMVLQAIAELQIDPAQSFIIGDKQRDLDAGSAAGVKGFLYTEGDLLKFVQEILA